MTHTIRSRHLSIAALLAVTAFAQQPPATVSVHVTTTPAGAIVACDGVIRQPAPCVLNNLSPGEHLLTATKDGYREARRTITVTAGQSTAVELKLEPLRGLVLLHSSPPEADIVIDGADRGRTPLLIADLPLGVYRVRLTRQGYLPREVELRIENRTPVALTVALTSDSATLRVESTPPGAAVRVNGINRGTTPCLIDQIPGGDTTVEMTLDGFETHRQTVRLAAGQEASMTAVLKAIPGEWQFVSIPEGARVYLNDRFCGQAPVTVGNLEPGSYVLKAELPGHEPLTRTIEVGRADRRVEEVRLEKNSGAVEITTQPAGVKVFVDGRPAGISATRTGETDQVSLALNIPLVPAGTHEIELALTGYYTRTVRVEVEKDKTVILHEKMVRRFIPDYEIRTRTDVYQGVLVGIDPSGNVQLEIRPGILRTFPATDIRQQGPWRLPKSE